MLHAPTSQEARIQALATYALLDPSSTPKEVFAELAKGTHIDGVNDLF